MKLALVLPGPLDRRSGGYSYDVDWCGHLRTRGHQVSVWSLPARGASRELVRRWSTEAPDLVVFDALVHRPITRCLERHHGTKIVPWVALVHHLAWLEDWKPTRDTARKKSTERRFLSLMDAFVFNSENTRQTVAELRGPGAPFRPSQVNFPPLTDAPAPASPPVEPTENQLLFLGNLTPRKNLHGLLTALGLLAVRKPNLRWRLTVVGNPGFDPRYAFECRRMATRYGLDSRVTWAGRLGDDALNRVWTTTDLLAVPSFHEGWGMVYAEAMIRGIVPLAGNRGGGAEAVGHAGLLVDPDSPEEICRTLEAFLEEPDRTRAAHRARTRGEFLSLTAGFGGLEEFLTSVAQPSVEEEGFDFDAYLEAKATVDSRALHRGVLDAAFSGVPAARVLELGGGTGTMARRLRDWGRLPPETRYELVDQRVEGLRVAEALCRDHFVPGAFTVRRADFHELGTSGCPAPDLVIAHAVLDLFDAASATHRLAKLGARRYWLTHIFDGMTGWEPLVDPELDEMLIRAYHRTMDERSLAGGEGSSRSGREWLTALPAAGLRILAAGSSDWIVRPENGGYPHNEAVFLKSILHFFRSSLTGRSDVDQKGLCWWLTRRQRQIDRGEAVFLAHQLDIAAEGPENNRDS